jgi:protein-tyrosine phosphatase
MEFYWIDGPWKGRLAIFGHPRGGDSLADDLQPLKENFDVVVSLLTDGEDKEFGLLGERQRCESFGLQFFQFPIVDVGVPASRRATLQFVRQLDGLLKAGLNVGIHCRMGVGRSGMIASCLLMLQGLSPAAAMEAVSTARDVIIPQTLEQREWLIAFYDFC